ncbi:hypothetical protein BN1058_02369 [Paraliobacillus sp. PM-2]|uniref:hypothetical protein n=1 Tax=Paraliobacillus sp. PM-2 TaxID=1462524 RepID=UPI00061C17C4|nr:hypothetical protein [Paraliobacillus sp. PM-2]CQR48027.1 hypothetical protein BN1058_02369 [Paraliobacillus sp. PM-2]
MKWRLYFCLSILTLLATLGCESNQNDLNKTKQEKNSSGIALLNDSESINNSIVKQVYIHEAPKKVSPSEAVIKQFEVEFEDGKKKFPTRKSILFETIIGSNSIVGIRSPEGEHNFAVFQYKHDINWYINSLLRIKYQAENNYNNKLGLALPMNKFNSINLDTQEDGDIWVFVDKETIVAITKFDRYNFNPSNKSKQLKLDNGTSAYLDFDVFNQPNLFYYDSSQLIVISGNVTQSILLEIANSLPSANSIYFPAKKQSNW